MNATLGKVTAIGVVRNKDGYIRTGNYENLSDEGKAYIRRLVEEDGFVTAESNPNKDERFLKWL